MSSLLQVFTVILLCNSLLSCQIEHRSATETVQAFLTSVNSPSKYIDTTLTTQGFALFLEGKEFIPLANWELTESINDDSSVAVQAEEIHKWNPRVQTFGLHNEEGGYRIFNSCGFISHCSYDFSMWAPNTFNLCDRELCEAVDEAVGKFNFKPLWASRPTNDIGYIEGEVEIINNSGYSKATFTYLIHHYDSLGNIISYYEQVYDSRYNDSLNHQTAYWTAVGCFDCKTQKFTIHTMGHLPFSPMLVFHLENQTRHLVGPPGLGLSSLFR